MTNDLGPADRARSIFEQLRSVGEKRAPATLISAGADPEPGHDRGIAGVDSQVRPSSNAPAPDLAEGSTADPEGQAAAPTPDSGPGRSSALVAAEPPFARPERGVPERTVPEPRLSAPGMPEPSVPESGVPGPGLSAPGLPEASLAGADGSGPDGAGKRPPGSAPAGTEVPGPPPKVAVPPDLAATLAAGASERAGVDDDPGDRTDDYGRPLHPGALHHELPRVMAVANQKGGVGKTTTTVNLGASLAELGYRVLVVDLDPQGNATTGLGVNARNLDASVYDVILHDAPIEDVIEPTSLRNLFVVPATIDLAGAEIELVPVFSRELRLRRALEPVGGDFDFVLIDCPPSLGLLTVNALAAAGEVLVPIQCEYYALEGLSQLLRNVNLVRTNLNERLEVSTIVLTMYDARTKLAEQVADEVRHHFGRRVCRSVVPRTVRLSEAPSFGQPVTTFDSTSRGAIAYRELAREVSGGAPQRIR